MLKVKKLKAHNFKETSKVEGMKLHKEFRVSNCAWEATSKYVFDVNKGTYSFPSKIVITEGGE